MRKSSNYLRQNRMSVKLKVTLWYACMLVLIVLLLFGFIFFVSRSLLQKKTDSSLEAAVQEFAEEIEFEGSYFELDDDLRFYEDGIIFSVYDDEGRLIAGNVPGNYPTDTVLKAYSFQTLSSGSSSWTVYDAALPYGNGRILWVRGILPAQTALSMERTMLIVLLIACPLLMGIALAVGYSITKRAFLPIEEIRQTAENIGEGTDLSRRISTLHTQGEIRQLADTFNQMLERLESSFEKERQFTSDASHELRTPIAVIRSQAEYALLDDVSPEEQREGLEIILKQAEKMCSLVSQLLTLARADRGTAALSMVPLDLSLLALNASEEYHEKAALHQLQLLTDIAPDIRVNGDSASLLRVFSNLLENAIQYGRPGGFVKLELSVQKENAVCRISDDGIGIAEEHLDHIWQRFYRADPSHNPGGNNTGLGLPMVKWIVEAHQGSICVESSPGKGSVFTFSLPLVPSSPS